MFKYNLKMLHRLSLQCFGDDEKTDDVKTFAINMKNDADDCVWPGNELI
jgi:hypothetical protein